MSEVLQANIFFFITSVSVVLVTILMGVILFYIISILQDIKSISRKLRKGSDTLEKDIAAVRRVIKRGSNKTRSTIDMFFGGFNQKSSRKRKKS